MRKVSIPRQPSGSPSPEGAAAMGRPPKPPPALEQVAPKQTRFYNQTAYNPGTSAADPGLRNATVQRQGRLSASQHQLR